MPVSIVVGGQFGSEGKGKVALEIVRREAVAAVIRIGGTNSGHTAVGVDGKTYALRQLPAAAADRSVKVVLPPVLTSIWTFSTTSYPPRPWPRPGFG
jgi:adenylosuccinate synthase